MIKPICGLFILVGFVTLSLAKAPVLQPESSMIQQQTRILFENGKLGTTVSQAVLPKPYDYLLTQPLMTEGIADYYQRTPMIKVIYATKNTHNNTYSRAILMLVDQNKARNNPQLAQVNNEALVVELAFISMNFNALPKPIIEGVLNSNVPFGQLLSLHKMKTVNQDRHYFSVICSTTLSTLTHCRLNSTIYGRTNTIIRADNHQWLAHVIEILPGIRQ